MPRSNSLSSSVALVASLLLLCLATAYGRRLAATGNVEGKNLASIRDDLKAKVANIVSKELILADVAASITRATTAVTAAVAEARLQGVNAKAFAFNFKSKIQALVKAQVAEVLGTVEATVSKFSVDSIRDSIKFDLPELENLGQALKLEVATAIDRTVNSSRNIAEALKSTVNDAVTKATSASKAAIADIDTDSLIAQVKAQLAIRN